MNVFRPLLAALMLALPPLSAQYVTDKDEARLLIPKAPAVQEPIRKLLLVGAVETESLGVIDLLRAELTRQQDFQVMQPPQEDALAKGIPSLESLTPEARAAIASRTGASHILWIRLERFSFKDMKSAERVRGITFFKWRGFAKAVLQCPVLDLATGKITALAPQNLYKEYAKDHETVAPVGFPPRPVGEEEARMDLKLLAARKALQMVVPVQVIQPLPFITGGDLGKVLKELKAGHLDEALARATALAAASGGESPKVQSRIQYDLGLLLCMKQRPVEGLAALQNAEKSGVDKAEVQKALEACRAMGAGAPR